MRRFRNIRPRPIGINLSVSAAGGFNIPFQGVWTVNSIGGGGGGCALWISPLQDGGAGQNGSMGLNTVYRSTINLPTSIGSGGSSGNPSDENAISGGSGGSTSDGISSYSGGSGGTYGGNPVATPTPFPSPGFKSYTIPANNFLGVLGLNMTISGGGQGGDGRPKSSGQGGASSGSSGGILYILKG